MTATEIADHLHTGGLASGLVLRYFAKVTGGEPKEAAAGRWRAALGEHYYTSDTCRLVIIGVDDNLVEGWGATPDEAAAALAAALIEKAEKRSAGFAEAAAKARTEAAELREKFR